METADSDGRLRRCRAWSFRCFFCLLLLSLLYLAFLPSLARASRRSDNIAQQDELFDSASQLYQQGMRDKIAAIDAFDRFLKNFPDSPRAADAQFMMGESYLLQALDVLRAEAASKKNNLQRVMAGRNQSALQSLENAREAFESVVNHYAKKSGLGASAQYRLGEVHYNQKDWGPAIDEFRKVEKDFPKSYVVPESWMGIIYANLALEQFSQAEANLFLLGETYPNYLRVPEVLYAQGIVSLHKGDYANAEKALRQVKTADAQFYLGKTYLLSKRPFLAATAFEQLVRDYPGSELKEESEFFIGDSFFLAQDFDGAITKYQRFLEKYPDSRLKVAGLFRIGSAYFQKKSYVDARANFQSVLDRYPQDFFAPLAQYFIAESYLVANQTREALFAYTKVITQFPETIKISPLAHYKLAWTQFQVGDYGQTVQTCHNFLALYPTHTLAKNIHLILGDALLAMKRYDEAVTAWQRIIDLAPTSEVAEQALYSILLSQYQQKNYDSILTSYQFIFRHLPPSQSKWRSLSYLYASEAYLALNQVDEAQAIYEMILKVYPNDPAAVYAQDGLAWCYTYKGQDDQALVERQKLKDLLRTFQAGGSTAAFTTGNEMGIAKSLYNQKSYEDAFQLFDKFARNNPQSPQAPEALYLAGKSLYESRYYSQAIETWQKLLENYSKSPEAQQAVYQVADTQFRAQKYADAIASYRNIIQKFPKSPQLALAYMRIANSDFNSKDDAGTIRDATALIDHFPDAQEALDSLDLLETVFDRSPNADFRAALGNIVKSHPRAKIAGEAQFRMASRLFDRKDYAAAAAEFQNFSVDFTDNPQLPKAQFMLAESMFQAGRYKDSVPAFQRYLDNFPRSDDTPRALFHLGSAHYNQKEYEPATTYYQRLIEEYPDSEFAKPTQFNLALAYKAMGKLDSAQEAYSKYIRLAGSGDANALAALWEVFGLQKDRKDYEQALQTLQQILAAAEPGSDTVLEATYNAADVYSMENRPDEAINNFEKLRGMGPKSSPFRLKGLIKLGEIYEKSDPARAVAVYEDLAKNATTAQLAQSARERAAALRSSLGSKPAPGAGPRSPRLPGAMPDSDSDPAGAKDAPSGTDDPLKTRIMPGDAPGGESASQDKPAPKRKRKKPKKGSDAASDPNAVGGP